MGVGAHRQRQHNIFDSEKLTHFSCATDGWNKWPGGHVIKTTTFFHLINPCKKFGPLYLGKATAAARAALPSAAGACWVFSFFRNPPNPDMDYRMFNVRI